jgi:hypothetical protein
MFDFKQIFIITLLCLYCLTKGDLKLRGSEASRRIVATKRFGKHSLSKVSQLSILYSEPAVDSAVGTLTVHWRYEKMLTLTSLLFYNSYVGVYG